MMQTTLTGLNRNRLRRWLAVFFLALAIPTGILVYQAYSQLKWEAFHQHRVLAEELAARIDNRYRQLLNEEETRSFSDYAFLVIAGDPSASFVQRSPLSDYPVSTAIPGLIGHFQVDAAGAFSTPLLPQPGVEPAAYGISADELDRRLALAGRMQQILSRNRLVRDGESGTIGGKAVRVQPGLRSDRPTTAHAPGTAADTDTAARLSLDDAAAPPPRQAEQQPAGQAAFDRLNEAITPLQQERKQKHSQALGRVEDLKLDSRYHALPTDEQPVGPAVAPAPLAEKRAARRERSALPEALSETGLVSAEPTLETETAVPRTGQSALRIHTFESEIDPFEISLLDSGHFVLFRRVWRDGQRYVQGVLIEQQPFLQGGIQSAFLETALSQMSELIVAYQGNVFTAFTGQAARGYLSSAEELRGALLYQRRLSAPLSGIELIFSITRLPAAPGSSLVSWIAAVLALVLLGGFYLMYRLGAGQIDLARQQQDFVSAVSHELKTPLTSIRMYGEMLREGWADDAKKQTYYDYIFDESERLSRLITNVLQLARMTRNDLQVDLRPVSAGELLDTVRSRVGAQVERAGFEFTLDCSDAAAGSVIRVDPDYFTQIIINLVDNAIKFSARAERRAIDLGCALRQDGSVLFTVRDYGPGVPRDQMKKIFKLFYRSENELTRETVGTGIGLALVHQLVLAMDGQVDIVNQSPGAEFRVSFATSS
ncbi:MAG: HAMP domain-containing histidine kinase [Gammaproteobacteria bacterium]|nr:HAMP domain-containing histidine kinase [Gammaproteobacteria bacterium]